MNQLVRTYYILFALSVMLAASAGVYAQNAAVPNERKQLDRLLGDWEGQATLVQGTTAIAFPISMHNSVAAGGAAIHFTLEAIVPGMGQYHEEDFITWDAQSGQVVLFAVSTAGEVGAYRGNWEGGSTNTLKLKENKIVGGNEIASDMTIVFSAEGTVNWSADVESQEGTTAFKCEFHRK